MESVDCLCGAPIGGYAFAQSLGADYHCPVIKAEKKVTLAGSDTQREESKLVFGRHSIEPGGNYAIVEDVCNNFSTTEQLIELILQESGG